MTRAALTQGCDPLVLTGDIWPKWRVWTLDPDRGVTGDRIEALSRLSGIAKEAYEAAMLRPIAEVVSGNSLHDKSTWPWVLALGSRNRRRRGGLQYCPRCLAEDRRPYFRLHWRLAWHTGCPRHGCRLLDRCPHCTSPIEPHRLSAKELTMAVCAACENDLRMVGPVDADADGLAFQRAADEAVASLEGHYGGKALPASEWFSLARYFVTLLRKMGMGKTEGLMALARSFGVDTDALQAPATGLAIELLPVDERAALLGDAWKFMSGNPNDFLKAAQRASLTVQSLREPRQRLPATIEKLVIELPDKRTVRVGRAEREPFKPYSRQAVMRMWARFQRKM
ncbi:TniQ protein [Methylomagnum ishizawai]|uniref:TniQ protein n=2 Tax=Methylomagnum ishizawai TaxID=1760988 RepID=A0A1Y6CWF4_9GAMM|nr:TniQ protein [Methylomagnum ishizawai]